MNKDKQIEEMLKCVCQSCRYFMRCNDDTIYNNERLSEILKKQCSTWQIGKAIYNAGYRKAEDIYKDIYEGKIVIAKKGE